VAEQTPIQRAARIYMAKQIGRPGAVTDYHPSSLDIEDTRDILTPALDLNEMARVADPEAFEDHPIERRSAVAALQWAARRKIATDHAQAIRAAILRKAP